MKITSTEFVRNPAAAYRAADKGEEVVITHDRYGWDFVLISKNEETVDMVLYELMLEV